MPLVAHDDTESTLFCYLQDVFRALKLLYVPSWRILMSFAKFQSERLKIMGRRVLASSIKKCVSYKE